MAFLVRLWVTQRFTVVGFLLCVLALAGKAAPVDFDHEIVPILRQRCADCHTGTKKKGGLSFNTREALMKGGENGPVVKPGNGAGSRLLEVVLSKDPDEQMPPKGDRLTPLEISRLKAWIDEGATWTTGFSFKRRVTSRPCIPGVRFCPKPTMVDNIRSIVWSMPNGPPTVSLDPPPSTTARSFVGYRSTWLDCYPTQPIGRNFWQMRLPTNEPDLFTNC